MRLHLSGASDPCNGVIVSGHSSIPFTGCGQNRTNLRPHRGEHVYSWTLGVDESIVLTRYHPSFYTLVITNPEELFRGFGSTPGSSSTRTFKYQYISQLHSTRSIKLEARGLVPIRKGLRKICQVEAYQHLTGKGLIKKGSNDI